MARKTMLRGDKRRDVLLYVYMHNKFSKEKIRVADLKKIGDYSAGGMYSAFESPYLEKNGDEIRLTEEGEQYVKERILPRYNVYRSYGNVLILIGFFLAFEWFEWNYLHTQLEPSIYLPAILLALGLFLRYFVLRFSFFITKRKKEIAE
jgi:hypothetical protein